MKVSARVGRRLLRRELHQVAPMRLLGLLLRCLVLLVSAGLRGRPPVRLAALMLLNLRGGRLEHLLGIGQVAVLVADEKVVLALLFEVIGGLGRVILVLELLSRGQASRRVVVAGGIGCIVIKKELLEVARRQLGRIDASGPRAMMVLVLVLRATSMRMVMVHRSQPLLLLLLLLLLLNGLQNACLLLLMVVVVVLHMALGLGVACGRHGHGLVLRYTINSSD